DPSDGRILWKRRRKVSELRACGSRVLALSPAALACIDPDSGKPVWEAKTPPRSRALTAAEGSALVLGGGEALAFSLADGTPMPQLPAAREVAFGADLSCALLQGDELSFQVLAAHLSLVTT